MMQDNDEREMAAAKSAWEQVLKSTPAYGHVPDFGSFKAGWDACMEELANMANNRTGRARNGYKPP